MDTRLVAYHGSTNPNIKTFELRATTALGGLLYGEDTEDPLAHLPAIWLTTSKGVAETYATCDRDLRFVSDDDPGYVYTVLLNDEDGLYLLAFEDRYDFQLDYLEGSKVIGIYYEDEEPCTIATYLVLDESLVEIKSVEQTPLSEPTPPTPSKGDAVVTTVSTPILALHGSPVKFDEFEPGYTNCDDSVVVQNLKACFFTLDEDAAHFYATESRRDKDDLAPGHVYKVRLSPDADRTFEVPSDSRQSLQDSAIVEAIEAGAQLIIAHRWEDNQYIVLDPSIITVLSTTEVARDGTCLDTLSEEETMDTTLEQSAPTECTVCGKRHKAGSKAQAKCLAKIAMEPSRALVASPNEEEVPWTDCPDCLELGNWCESCERTEVNEYHGRGEQEYIETTYEVVDEKPVVDRTTALYELQLVRRIRAGEVKRSELARFASRSKSELGRSNYYVRLAAGAISMKLWRKAVVLRDESLSRA